MGAGEEWSGISGFRWGHGFWRVGLVLAGGLRVAFGVVAGLGRFRSYHVYDVYGWQAERGGGDADGTRPVRRRHVEGVRLGNLDEADGMDGLAEERRGGGVTAATRGRGR